MVGLVQRGGAGRGRRFGPDGRDPGQAEPVGYLGRHVGAVLELLAVHDADLERLEAAHGRLFERPLVGFGEQVEDRGEDPPRQVDLGQADCGDVHVAGHGGPS